MNMRDDRLQGIIFSQSNVVDLVRHSRIELFQISLRKQRTLLQHKTVTAGDVVLRANPVRQVRMRRADAQRADLLDRLKINRR